MNKLNFDIAGILKKVSKSILVCLIILSPISCNDFLDVVPDDIPNLDHVFANEREAENYLATLYSYAPHIHSWGSRSLTFLGGDDIWTYTNGNNLDKSPGLRISRGEQNANNPYENYWDGSMFSAIRDCNIFIEELSKPERVPELSASKRMRWIAEAKFLKAYYHFVLFRMYGPIPITDTNIPVGDSNVSVKRNTVDEVVNYISDLLDEAIGEDGASGGPTVDVGLPLIIENMVDEAGRVTRGAAYMLKARVWATAASPLFNGNPDYKDFADKDGVLLFPQEVDNTKWEKAIEACEKALESLPGTDLYYFTQGTLNEKTQYQMNLRNAVTENFNKEIIWGRVNQGPYNNYAFQAEISVPQMNPNAENGYQHSAYSVTLNMVERFYTKNGVPIDEDKNWDYAGRYNIKVTDSDQKYNLIEGYNTAVLNQDRENRFYASLMFDGCVVYMKSTTEDGAYPIRALFTDLNGATSSLWVTVTGYWIRKLIYWDYKHSAAGADATPYAWPEMRLADLKLLYAEALNEVGRRTEAIKHVDDIRARSGLKGVVESWKDFSKFPNKPSDKDGLREIIHQEREIELAFEGHRIWDLRRWKKSVDFMNKDVRGWNLTGRTPAQYYQVNKIHEQTFVAPRDYLWPLSINSLLRNSNLVQNPGW